MRIVCISDCHGRLPVIPPCDLLLIAGDITPTSDHSEGFQSFWLQTVFRNWLNEIPARQVCGVAGNHDFVFQTRPELVPGDLRWIYLQDSAIEIDGIKIYGTPWQPWFCDWAFNSPRQDGEKFLAEKFAGIPEGTDILLSHGAPRGYGDFAPANGPNGGEHVGSTALLDRIRQVRPSLTVFGHLHNGHGVYKIDIARRQIILANVAVLDDGYEPANAPMKFDIAREAGLLNISQVD